MNIRISVKILEISTVYLKSIFMILNFLSTEEFVWLWFRSLKKIQRNLDRVTTPNTLFPLPESSQEAKNY